MFEDDTVPSKVPAGSRHSYTVVRHVTSTTHDILHSPKYCRNKVRKNKHLSSLNTHSLPVQKLDASDASHVTTPRSSSGRPSRPSGLISDHVSSRCGSLSAYVAVILLHQSHPTHSHIETLTVCKCSQVRACSPEYPVHQARTPCFVPSAASQTWTCCTAHTRDPAPLSVTLAIFLSRLTLFVMLPDTDAIRIMLPPRPNRAICRPAACAVKRTPVAFTSSTCPPYISTPRQSSSCPLTSLNCSPGHSKHPLGGLRIPAAATQKSNRCSLSPISSAFFHITS